MKMNGSEILIACFAVVLAAAFALAQTTTENHNFQHRWARQGYEARILAMMTRHLQLTEAQQAQVKQVFASQKPIVIPLMQKLAQSRQQLNALAQTGTFDEAKARAIASQQAQSRTDLEVAKTHAMSDIFSILTTEQKTKAADFLNKRQVRLLEHLQDAGASEKK